MQQRILLTTKLKCIVYTYQTNEIKSYNQFFQLLTIYLYRKLYHAFLPRCIKCRAVQSGESCLSVRPSVRPSVCRSVCQTRALWKNGTKRKKDLSIFL